ncbi:MAG: uncharacterized protein KVP18_002689 [Porospora cf. gigantea A]|uniref:uncharacterized protein n=1 Tax=Porospora cf. gigantea A TaxID=2853593 RepID=UPI00355A12A9|nr:MAG: hypothetical protein KVP18_002689 [Porospora cf. gigantea A]
MVQPQDKAKAMLAMAVQTAQRLNHSSHGAPESPVVGVVPQQWLNPSSRHARKIYVGKLPANTNPDNITEISLCKFFNDTFSALLPNKLPGPVVVGCHLNSNKKYAFIELRTISEAQFSLTLDGLLFMNCSLKLRRPQDYNGGLAQKQQADELQHGLGVGIPGISDQNSKDLVPTTPLPGETVYVSPVVEDGPNKLFLGGVPVWLTEDEVKEWLLKHGRLRAFQLMREKTNHPSHAGHSKGYAFCEYVDAITTDYAIKALRKDTLEGRVVTVRRTAALDESTDANSAAVLGHEGKLGAEAAIYLQCGSMPWIDSMPVDSKKHKEMAPTDEYDSPEALLQERITQTYGRPSRAIGVKNALEADVTIEDTKEITKKLQQICEKLVGKVCNACFHEAEGGQILLEFPSACVALRALELLNGRTLNGRPIFSGFVKMPKEMQHSSVLRMVAELDAVTASDDVPGQWSQHLARYAARSIPDLPSELDSVVGS